MTLRRDPRYPKTPKRASRMPGLPSGIPVAPILSALGLVAIAAVSLALLRGELPFLKGGGGDGGPIRTATPSNVVVVDPRAKVLGSIVYVKAGNVWIQKGEKAVQLTTGGFDSMPSFSPDGTSVYFIREAPSIGLWRFNGEVRRYELETPSLMRVPVDGGGPPTSLYVGRLTSGKLSWQTFIRQPRVSPDGTTVALMTDGPDPSKSDVVLKFFDLATGKLRDPQINEITPLGHQDPAWAPDGASILYVKDAHDLTRGTPSIFSYSLATKKSTAVTGPGYMQPSWSPDGRFIAATRTSALGTDVAILDAKTGQEVLRVTADEASFAPVWSPAGDAIAFLRVDGGVVDLELAKLAGTPGTWIVEETLAMTESAGLDAASGASWFIPADLLPTPAPTLPPATPAASGGPSPT